MAKKKKENIEEVQQETLECGLTEEDRVISLEGITKVEKNFINLVRNFHCQGWLFDLIGENFEEILEAMVAKSVEDQALQETIEDFHTKQIPLSDIYIYYQDKLEEVQSREDYLDETIQHWADTIQETLDGELVPTEE